MALTKVSGGILQQPIDVGIITATSIQVGSGTTIHDTGIDLGSGNITSHNINSTGIITSTGLDVNGNGDISGDLSVSGNVSIGGTLTYEDVTNIDSVGIITARDGINVTGGHIGVGVTPESWSTIFRAVQIGRQGCITGQTSENIVEISANAYHNSGWKYIENDTATSYYQYQGNHVFSSAASGTAAVSASRAASAAK